MTVDDKDLIQSDRKILYECEAFHKNLYSSKVQVNDYPGDFFPPMREVLSEESKQHCKGLSSLKECLEALDGMATEKHLVLMVCHVNFIKFLERHKGKTNRGPKRP